jgi:hypothetical protein
MSIISNKIQLPDFDELSKLIDEIGNLSIEKSKLDIKIKFAESEIVRIATTDPKYFQNGKAPSFAYIDSTWKYSGFNNELIPLRNELAEYVSRLEKCKLKFDFYKMLIDVWRSESANSRISIT